MPTLEKLPCAVLTTDGVEVAEGATVWHYRTKNPVGGHDFYPDALIVGKDGMAHAEWLGTITVGECYSTVEAAWRELEDRDH